MLDEVPDQAEYLFVTAEVFTPNVFPESIQALLKTTNHLLPRVEPHEAHSVAQFLKIMGIEELLENAANGERNDRLSKMECLRDERVPSSTDHICARGKIRQEIFFGKLPEDDIPIATSGVQSVDYHRASGTSQERQKLRKGGSALVSEYVLPFRFVPLKNEIPEERGHMLCWHVRSGARRLEEGNHEIFRGRAKECPGSDEGPDIARNLGHGHLMVPACDDVLMIDGKAGYPQFPGGHGHEMFIIGDSHIRPKILEQVDYRFEDPIAACPKSQVGLRHIEPCHPMSPHRSLRIGTLHRPILPVQNRDPVRVGEKQEFVRRETARNGQGSNGMAPSIALDAIDDSRHVPPCLPPLELRDYRKDFLS